MLRKWFLIPMLGSLAFLFVAVDTAQAQRLRERRQERRDARRGYTTGLVSPGDAMPLSASAPRISYYYTPGLEGMADAARVRVILPDAQGKVFFDGAPTMQTGTERLFNTPKLTGANNSYVIRATFMQAGREESVEQTVNVMPGRTVVINFARR